MELPTGSPPKKKKKNKISTRTAAKETFLEFCDSTSVHGVQYIGVRKRFDRFGWIVLVLGFLSVCVIYVSPIVEKWQKNPIELAFEEKFVPISEISFPAITICPLQMPHNRYNYSVELQKASRNGFAENDTENLQLFKLVTQTCFSQLGNFLSELTNAAKAFPGEMSNSNIDNDYEFINKYFLPSMFSLYKCKGVKIDELWKCDVEFHRHLLDVGLCYSFNMLPRDKILRQGVEYPLARDPNYVPPNISYFSSDKKSETLFKVSHTHQELELETHFHTEYEQEICKPDFLLYIHNPNELPWDQTNRFRMQLHGERELFVAIEPDVIHSDETLRRYSPKERDCYFTNEFPLKYFREYSRNNCEYECYINATEQKLKCLPDFMPHIVGETQICNLSVTIQLLQGIWNFENEKRSPGCNCLNDCNSKTYDIRLSDIHHSRKTAKTSSLLLSRGNCDEEEGGGGEEDNVFVENLKIEIAEKMYLATTNPKDIPQNFTEEEIQEKVNAKFCDLQKNISFNPSTWDASYLHIYYSKTQFLPMKRYTTYTFADFISQCGGIFGGIMGFSFLSFIEIFYFCTIRFLEKRKLTPIDVLQDELGELK